MRSVPLLYRGAPLLYRVLLVLSVWLLLRGHNEPGGGFVAGLVASLATTMLALGKGTERARLSLPFGSALTLAAFGGLLSLLSGLPALLAGKAFLTHLAVTLPIGANGFKLSTFLPFDIGIYLAVWGALAGQIIALLDGDAPDEAT